MPPQTTQQTGVLAKLGAQVGKQLASILDKHKDDKPTPSGQAELPPGLEDAVARLIECKFDVYKKGDLQGKVFFYAAAAVVSPEEFNGIPVKNRRTSIMEPLCETPKSNGRKTLEEHAKWITDRLKELGATPEGCLMANLEATCAQLKALQPYVLFRTWKGKPSKDFPNPRTNHTWMGTINWKDEVKPGAGVQDNSGKSKAAPSTNGSSSGTAVSAAPAQTASAVPQAEPTPAFDEFGDLDSLVEKANPPHSDPDAQAQLTELAVKAGLTEAEANAADSWEALKDAILAQQGGGGQEEGEGGGGEADPNADEGWPPKPGDLFGFQPPDKNGKEGPLVQVEITEVDAVKETACFFMSSNKKRKFKDVPFSKLKNAPE